MELLEKLTILSDAAKYDAACTSSGSRRGFRQGYIGSTSSSVAGCCHSFSADGARMEQYFYPACGKEIWIDG